MGTIHNLEGPIEMGDLFVWEPTLAHACTLSKVVGLRITAYDELWVELRIVNNYSDGSAGTCVAGDQHWVEEGRVREACVRIPIEEIED